MPTLEKFKKKTLNTYGVDPEIYRAINAGFEHVSDISKKQEKRDFFTNAITIMNSCVSRETMMALMDDNGCCRAGHLRYHYEIMLDCQLKLESVYASPLDTDGEEPCGFIFSIMQ